MCESYPPLVVLLKTWQGPRERGIGQQRLDALGQTVASFRKHAIYPNYSWHVADDGSDPWYKDGVLALFRGGEYTFSSTYADGDPGLNLNTGMRIALKRADLVLHWSDDILLERDYDLRPYVELLETCQRVGRVRMRPAHPSIDRVVKIRLCDRYWHLIVSARRFAVDTALVLDHRRFWDFYGPYPEGLRLDIMQEEMTWRYNRKMRDGPRIVVPDELWKATHPKWGAPSTWDWQITEKGQPDEWKYRSYGARPASGEVSATPVAQKDGD